ncbi:MAG: hypothetical protein K9W44_06145 [Candidatus Lokiarchaeota archaeon]|nr:hypothetical protein [Candidatus Harpocratesius repetitus]
MKAFLKRYSPDKFPEIDIYCISIESYHGFRTPIVYINAVQKLTKYLINRLTLMTNANLNKP